ncbi:MAG: glycosyl transferase family 2, partial [Deltaproteobacteria bacterium]|nr:glycosyl transferase family 2 [Deltaproteobacteria bacterium]
MNYIIPVHNEAENISNVVRNIISYDHNSNICILNSASTDESISLLRGYQVHVIDAPKGYPQALSYGYRYACDQGWESLIQLDG